MEAEKGTQLEKTTKRVRLTVAYDGTNYHGWQIQNNGITIESELNRCLTDLLREPVEVIGASRTDSGVHAMGNVAVFDTEASMHWGISLCLTRPAGCLRRKFLMR